MRGKKMSSAKRVWPVTFARASTLRRGTPITRRSFPLAFEASAGVVRESFSFGMRPPRGLFVASRAHYVQNSSGLRSSASRPRRLQKFEDSRCNGRDFLRSLRGSDRGWGEDSDQAKLSPSPELPECNSRIVLLQDRRRHSAADEGFRLLPGPRPLELAFRRTRVPGRGRKARACCLEERHTHRIHRVRSRASCLCGPDPHGVPRAKSYRAR